MAVVLFTVFAASAVGGEAPTWSGAGAIFARELLGGCLLGVLGWLVIHHVLPRATDYATGLLVSLAAVAGMYATAQHIEVSGPIAVVVAGLLTGNVTLQRLHAGILAQLRTFWTGLDDVLNALLFVFVGLHVVLINPLVGVVIGVPALVAVAAVLAGRAAAVWLVVSGLSAGGQDPRRPLGAHQASDVGRPARRALARAGGLLAGYAVEAADTEHDVRDRGLLHRGARPDDPTMVHQGAAGTAPDLSSDIAGEVRVGPAERWRPVDTGRGWPAAVIAD